MPITVSSQASSGQELLAEVDEELGSFEEFFRVRLDNQPLTPAEKAILRTYLHWATLDKHNG